LPQAQRLIVTASGSGWMTCPGVCCFCCQFLVNFPFYVLLSFAQTRPLSVGEISTLQLFAQISKPLMSTQTGSAFTPYLKRYPDLPGVARSLQQGNLQKKSTQFNRFFLQILTQMFPEQFWSKAL